MQLPSNNNVPNPNEKGDRARMIAAVVISLLILFAFHHFVDAPRLERARQEAAKIEATKVETSPAAAAATEHGKMASDTPAADGTEPRDKAIAETPRVTIEGSEIAGSLSLKGAAIDDLSLLKHYTDVERTQHVALLSPSSTEHAFFTGGGWVSSDDKTPVPGNDTVWRVAAGSPAKIVAGAAPVKLEWDNGQGVTFEKEIALDDHYLFSVTDRAVNKSASDLKLGTYSLVSRRNQPVDFAGMFILHEGPFAVLNEKKQAMDYKSLVKGDKLDLPDVTGYIGFTDKYWMVMTIPDAKTTFDARMIGTADSPAVHHFQTDAVSALQDVKAGATLELKSHIYAGVKSEPVIKEYEEKYGFKGLMSAMDFGIWWFITMPFYWLLHALMTATGNIAIAILLMTVIVRGCMFNLASKSFKSMAKMKVVSPMLKELQEKYKHDKATMQMEIYELYKREDVNPLSGCWPMLVQIPVFFALYKVILLSVELRHAPFWGWIHDLSAPDPTSIFTLFGLIPWNPPAALMIGAWPALFCLTMIIQKRLSPPLPDETQEKLQTYFPYIITVMLAHFAAGLVIYWTWSNILGVLQQYYILRKFGGEETSLIRGHVSRRKKKAKA